MSRNALLLLAWLAAGGLALGPSPSSAQYAGWTQYTHGAYARAIVDADSCLWVGTNAGLMKMMKATGERTFYNGGNSPLHIGHIRPC